MRAVCSLKPCDLQIARVQNNNFIETPVHRIETETFLQNKISLFFAATTSQIMIFYR